MTRAELVELVTREAVVTLRCEEEDIPFEGNASALDPVTDAETNDWIRSELEAGNQWAWCHVELRATWHGLTGGDALGGCSYESEEAFRRPGGYFDDMKRTAIDEIVAKAEKIGAAIGA